MVSVLAKTGNEYAKLINTLRMNFFMFVCSGWFNVRQS
jgi:hypothetical protein